MKKVKWSGFVALGLILSLSGCGSYLFVSEEFSFDGTVTYINLEGGSYGIVSDDNIHYDPINLDSSYNVDGLRVRVTAKRRENTSTMINMWGTGIEILDIERIE